MSDKYPKEPTRERDYWCEQRGTYLPSCNSSPQCWECALIQTHMEQQKHPRTLPVYFRVYTHQMNRGSNKYAGYLALYDDQRRPIYNYQTRWNRKANVSASKITQWENRLSRSMQKLGYKPYTQ